MARYVIRNLTNGRVVIPHPINRPINRASILIVTAPAHLMEQFDFRARKHPIAEMIRRGMISVVSVIDTWTPESTQVATVEIVRSILPESSGQYYFGQRIYSGANISPGTNLPGTGFFDFTVSGLVFFNQNRKLQNCRVFLNGVMLVNGDGFTHYDVRIGSSPAQGDLIFDNESLTIVTGDIISIEANV